jgi:hypothetical protein
VDGDGAGVALMGRSWAVLFSLLTISVLSLVEFPLALGKFFLLV